MPETDSEKTPEQAAEERSLGNYFDHALVTPFEYAHAGDTATASFVRFMAPSSKHSKEVAWIKQAMTRAFTEWITMLQQMQAGRSREELEEMVAAAEARQQDRKTAKKPKLEDEKMDAATVIGILSSSQTIEYHKVLEASRRLFISTPPAIAFVDGEEKLTSPLYDKLTYDDAEGMMGAYLGFFFGGSVLKILSTA